MNYLNLNIFCFYCCRPAHRSAQAGVQAGTVAEQAGLRAGPNRCQAGPKPEAAGLEAGPGRALGRASNGNSRPAGRLKPTPRPGTLACGTATTGGVCGNGESERGREDAGGLKTMGNSP